MRSSSAVPLLELRDVVKTFPRRSPLLRRTVGWVQAVDGVDLAVGAGETIGLVGESGSGKSTLGRLALGLAEPTSGQVLLEGTDLAGLDRRGRMSMRRKVQFVFQDPYSSLDPFRPVGDSIAEPLRTHRVGTPREREERVGALLDLVGLRAADGQRYPHEFSGGQLQRIAIARALPLDPRLIVLDEPVSSLDVSTQAEIINLLAVLQAEVGVAFLFISHDLAVVENVSARVAVMYLGQIVEQGPTAEVVHRPRHPYTQALLSAVPGQRDRTVAPTPLLAEEADVPTDTARGCRFWSRCPHAIGSCESVDPAPVDTPDGSIVACHLHTEGPTLAGRPLSELAAAYEETVG